MAGRPYFKSEKEFEQWQRRQTRYAIMFVLGIVVASYLISVFVTGSWGWDAVLFAFIILLGIIAICGLGGAMH